MVVRQRPEQILQRSIVQYLRAVLTPATWFTHIPLGGGGRLRGAILKSMGAVAGAPDILIVHAGKALFLELKSPKGSLSKVQKQVREAIDAAGSIVFNVRNIEAVRAALDYCDVPRRDRK